MNGCGDAALGLINMELRFIVKYGHSIAVIELVGNKMSAE